MTDRSDAGGARIAPRQFCGAGYPWPLLDELQDGVDVVACYFVRDKRRLETRQGKPYLKLTLGDRTGEIVAHIWDDADRWDGLCPVNTVVGVRARSGLYQDRLQLKIDAIQPLGAEDADFERLVPTSPRDTATMERELDLLVASVEDAALKALLRRCVGRSSAIGRAFRVHPAAMRNHHGYRCGLLEHSLSVAHAADRLAGHYREQGFGVDRDLLVAAALLHDIGKLRELDAPPASGYTTEGRLLGHIVIGMQIVHDEGSGVPELSEQRLLLLQHLIASHQGRPEWDSPRVPQTVEAIILHYADDLDAKLNQARALLRGVAPGDWSAYDRSLERSLFQPHGGQPAAAEQPAPGADEALDVMLDMFPR